MAKTALEKRIKRRITARTHRFFAVCAPEMNNLCYRELKELNFQDKYLNFQDIEVIKGGVEFTGTIQDCYLANLYLRSPSRILMRIDKFKAENFRTFEKKLREIEWELYIKPPEILPDSIADSAISTSRDSKISINDSASQISDYIKFEVSTNSSRLYHKDAVAQRAQKIFYEYFSIFKSECGRPYCYSSQPPSILSSYSDCSKTIQTIMIRNENDIFQISIDSSGELLHKRGLKENVGAAPIRETIAFSILNAVNYHAVNYQDKTNLPLIDGMCGSGTFALEAAMILNNIPAGFFREFAFQDWASFSVNNWNYIKKRAEENMINNENINELSNNTDTYSIFAIDQNADILTSLEKTLEKFNLSSSVKVINDNFFNIVPTKIINNKENRGFIILNPPYGKRIGDSKAVHELFADIGKKLKLDFSGWKSAVIIPDKQLLKYFKNIKRVMPIFHGGLKIDAVIIG